MTYTFVASRISGNGNAVFPDKLIIDDDKEIHMLMGKQLEALYTVVCASSGKEALDILKTEPLPQLILLDITMPELDGIGALKGIKAADPNAVCIMCSAMGQQASTPTTRTAQKLRILPGSHRS